jgi:hypothetical protein
MNEAVSTPSQPLTPDQQLASTIAAALVANGQILEAHRESFISKLSTGKMKEQDWRSEIAASLKAKLAADVEQGEQA